MLNQALVAATLPAVDISRARKFYTELLGLKVTKEDESPGFMVEAGNKTMLYIYERGATKADNTAASFYVKDVEKEVNELKEKGVKFEEYDLPGLKTVNGIVTMGNMKAAWFKDTEGNILGITQM